MLCVAQRACGATSRKAYTRRQVAGPRLHQRSVADSTCDNVRVTPTKTSTAIADLRKCKERISSLEQAKSLSGVGEKTAQKVNDGRRSLCLRGRCADYTLNHRSWRSSKQEPCGVSMLKGRKISRSYSSLKAYMESVCLSYHNMSPIALICPARTINRILLVFCRLPHS